MIVYKYDTQTKEFIQELKINEAYGTNIPLTTTVKPLTKKEGFAICFNDTKWEYVEDFRNTIVYNKETKEESKIDYLGKIKEDVTTLNPEQFDNWNYETDSWIEDIEAKRTTEINTQIAEAKQYLTDTGWIWEKYSRNVLVLKDMTSDEFNLKYSDIIAKQEEYRALINELEVQLEGN